MSESVERRKVVSSKRGRLSLSERLLVVLTGEIEALEKVVKDYKPNPAEAGKRAAGEEVNAAGAKGRIEVIGQATRTLEKLLELKRLEALAMRGGGDEDGEAVRLAAELMKRLRALDARRERPTLFGADGTLGGEAIGEGAAGAGGVAISEGSAG